MFIVIPTSREFVMSSYTPIHETSRKQPGIGALVRSGLALPEYGADRLDIRCPIMPLETLRCHKGSSVMQKQLPIFLITGAPGTGKTSVATALMRRFPYGLHIPV